MKITDYEEGSAESLLAGDAAFPLFYDIDIWNWGYTVIKGNINKPVAYNEFHKQEMQ